ncbi:helix-turn-helix transcriptional regulator [Pseudooceanicola nanhaiensis]|uniref:helix-turn-helix transcriptional regulator n=1 Tax=Pseudooceanicola nanhaiensis TaxID=375761 RepID=UPI0040595CD9
MGYRHDFTGRTDRIRSTAPVKWRLLDGLLAAYWEAEGEADGRGYYVSANPRLSIFLTDVSSIDVTSAQPSRPMARAIFVPAGVALQTVFTRPLVFSHLDIHMDIDWAVRFLAPALDRASAEALLARPVDLHDIGALEPVARLLVDELQAPARHDLYAESLAGSLVTGLHDIGGPAPEPGNARLTQAQLRRVADRFEAGGGRRLTIAQMAEAVNLSESWFSQVFKKTMGVTPHQWQLTRRIEMSKRLLSETGLSVADVADRLGFADQAHLTKTFRQVTGETPAAWRRAHR